MSEMVKKDTHDQLPTAEQTRGTVTYTPRFDILETDDELTLYGDLPGAGPEDLDIRFENDHLLVHAKVPPRHDGRELIYSEYGVGDYYREFRISEAVDAAKISAEMKNGVLTLHLPKSESVKPRRIEVTAE